MAFHSPSPRKMGRQEGKIKKKQHQPWVVPWLCPSWAQSPRAERGEGFAGWQKELTPGTAFPRMAGLDRVQEVSSPFGATAGACIACLEITRAGSRSGLLLSSPHLPFPSALPSLGPNTLLFLSPHPTSEHHAGVDLCCVSQFSSAHSCPPCILQVSGSALSLSTAAVSLRRQGCVPALPSISYPPSSLSISGSLVQIWTQAFLTVLSSLLSPSPWKRHCKYIPLLCLVFSLIYISKGVDLPPFPWRDYSRT